MTGIYHTHDPINFHSVNPQTQGMSAVSGERRSSGAKVYTAGALAGGVIGTGAGYLTGKVRGDSFIKSKDLEGKLSKLCEELEKNNETLKNLNARNAGLEKSYYKSAEEYFSRMIKLVEPKRQEITELMISKVINEVEKPNCFLIYGKNKEYCEAGLDFIKMSLCLGEKVYANEQVLNCDDDLVGALKELRSNYQKTKLYNLLHIRDFDLLINPRTSDDETIGAMKSIMGDCAEVFHTTILFTTTNPEELDDIAMEPHRVESVSFEDIDGSKQEPGFSGVRRRYIETKEKYDVYEKERSVLSERHVKLLTEARQLEAEYSEDIKKVKGMKKRGGLAGAVIGLAAGLGLAALMIKRNKNKQIINGIQAGKKKEVEK